uniref:Glutamine synthetase n=1 Tax=Leptolegnia chapmanii TaxID=92984 RepID=Q2VF32_9STRA|nr:glutamine synthetase [Leptolegnia chapmanii]
MSKLDRAVYDKYMELDTGSFIQAEYVWVGGSGEDLRCKTRTLDKYPASVEELPIWNFDGSSTGQAPGADSEVMLKPAAIYKDPFRRGNHILVMCDCYKPDMTPIPSNTRFDAARVMKACEKEVPWFGIEQEYTLFEADKVTPYGWPKGGFPGSQGPYYCGAGAHSAFGRLIADAHYRACLYAGIRCSGINAEVMPGQWEYQVGPCTGIEAGDQMWISRYILLRVCEDFGVIVSFDPKPIPGDWNGAGCHTNVSTKAMREDGGMKHIIEALEKLKLKHKEHIAAYGTGNERRLTGRHETASIDQFSYGVANRGASVRIPRTAEADGKGYFEDRRPASNMDPYVVTGRIMKTISLNEA